MSSKEQIMQAAYGPTGYVTPKEKQAASPEQKVVMSRELLKRAATILHDHFDGVAWVEPLLDEIETELAQPEPKPVAWMVENHPANKTFANFTPNFNSHFEKLGCKITPLYAEPADQSEQIAELIAQRTMQESIIKSAYTACRELEQSLAALQAQRKPLTDDEIDAILDSEAAESGGSHAFAKAIETAHGIGE